MIGSNCPTRWRAEEKRDTAKIMSNRPTIVQRARRIAGAGLLIALFLAGQSHAASSEWLTAGGGAIRLVASQPKPDGSIPAILEVRLEPGWKTYWRDPGASGIPPQITLDPEGGLVLETMRYPAPQTFGDGAGRYAGYDAPVAFPLVLRRMSEQKDVTIRASVFLGICEDICIPVQGKLELTLKGGEFDNPLDGARIAKAFASLPQAPSEDFKVADARFDAAAGVIHIDIRLPDEAGSDEPELFLAGPPGVFFGKPAGDRASGPNRRVNVPVKLVGKDGHITGQPIALTVRVGDRSMETTLAFD